MRDVAKMTFLAVLIPLIGFMMTPSTEALTTFGKTNPQTQNQPPVQPTPGGRSRACKLEAECRAIQNTTCIADTDGKTRCLCGDFSAPVNGACSNTFKGVRFPCNDDVECGPYAQCIQKNSTRPGKLCECREDAVESNRICSGSSPILRISMTMILMISGSLIIL